MDVLGFTLLGALTKDYNDDPEHASRPFDRDRTGFVLGEGAVVMALEELDSARARGATIHAEIAGYGSRLNAYRMTDPPPDGGGAVIAMTRALGESGFAAEDVDYVVAHGTGTPAGDISETVAIKRAFGDHAQRLLVTSPKSMTGHTTCAAGALNLLAALGAIRDGVVSPTINLDHPDPELDLDYVPNEARTAQIDVAMTNAFAFGGTNGALVVCRPELRDASMSRWSTLDRILTVEPGESATALRNVPNTLAIFDTHFPRFPVLPGVLILGSLGALAAELLEAETEQPWRLAGADRVAFRHFVQPGDQLLLTVKLSSRTDADAVLSGEVSVDGRVVTRARKLRWCRDELPWSGVPTVDAG